MNPEIKQLWIDALRSGDYAQDTSKLHNTFANTYCCLGVLCDLAVKAGVATEEEYGSFGNDEDRSQGTLPNVIGEWSGVDPEGRFKGTTGIAHTSLIGLNDDAGYTFEQIADVIEAQF
jgi:hypothetical protein